MSRGKRTVLGKGKTIPVAEDTFGVFKKMKRKDETWDKCVRRVIVDKDSSIWGKM